MLYQQWRPNYCRSRRLRLQPWGQWGPAFCTSHSIPGALVFKLEILRFRWVRTGSNSRSEGGRCDRQLFETAGPEPTASPAWVRQSSTSRPFSTARWMGHGCQANARPRPTPTCGRPGVRHQGAGPAHPGLRVRRSPQPARAFLSVLEGSSWEQQGHGPRPARRPRTRPPVLALTGLGRCPASAFLGVHGASGTRASQAAASRSTAQEMDAGGSARPARPGPRRRLGTLPGREEGLGSAAGRAPGHQRACPGPGLGVS